VLTRIISGLAMAIAGVALCLYGPPWFWNLFIFAVSMRLNAELAQIMEAKGYRHARRMTTLFSAIIVAATGLQLYTRSEEAITGWRLLHPIIMSTQAAALCMAFIGSFCIFLLYDKPRATLADVASSYLGIVYAGWFASFWILIRWMPNGNWLLLLAAFGVAYSDSTAYLVGRVAGKHPFFPQISPNKTIEGAAGSLILTTVTMAFVGPLVGVPLPHSLILGILIGLSAQAGDLAESLLKRDAGVKDSANLIPGHGGLLDRFDGFLFAGPVAYFYLSTFVVP
jgi:CDP-diglyceride synthetase